MTSPASPPTPALDLRVILESALRLFAPWLVAVLLVTWAGYPGVVCVTPLAWLMALSVGARCASRSSSPKPSQRLLEAALAGALFGLLQGVLFFFIAPRLGPINADEQASAIGISFGMLCVGVPAGAGLSAFNAWLVQRRRGVA